MSRGELDALKDAAMALSEKERAKLASDLMASLDGPAEKGVAEAWDIELCRRINEIEAGNAEVLDPEDVLARARERIRGATSGVTAPTTD
jgi:putative addiction module component (TIGR02574 family)